MGEGYDPGKLTVEVLKKKEKGVKAIGP
jgi:hypothetical protein